MRVLLGIILGAVLTVGGAYLYDSRHIATTVGAPASAQRPLVNWDIVAVKWGYLTTRVRAEWHRIAAQ